MSKFVPGRLGMSRAGDSELHSLRKPHLADWNGGRALTEAGSVFRDVDLPSRLTGVGLFRTMRAPVSESVEQSADTTIHTDGGVL